MGDNLHELNRKELKGLCSQNNIRTAGVKHEDLVRLLRGKLYPSTPQTPRSMKARGPKVQSPRKDDGDSYKTPGKAAGKGRNLRSSTLPLEDASATPRKNSGLSRKPLLTKSNTMSTRRTNLLTKTPGVDQDVMQENFVRRLCQINGLSPLSRKGQLDTASKASRLSMVNSNGKSEDMTSPRASEGNASGTADVEPSDAGSDASRRISEIATDAGPDTLSDFSDADEFRSVSSEPISKLSSTSKRNPLRTFESSKMPRSGLSSFTAGTWDTSDHPRSMDNLLVDGNNSGRRDVSEVIFPEFSEDSNFLVGDTDALDLSFLHAGAADPEVIVNGKDHDEIPVYGKDSEVKEFDVMDSPMARDYVTYNRGSETDITENCIDSSRISIGELTSDQVENPKNLDMENSVATSIDATGEQRDSAAIVPAEGAESMDVGLINGLAPGNEGTESKQSYSGIMLSDHAEPVTEDVEDGPEIHSELPCLESHSPPFDSKDYSVAKRLVFEPEDNITPSAPLQSNYDAGEDISNFRNSEGGPALSVPKTVEEEDFSLHSKSISSLDEPTSPHGGLAETVSETRPPAVENTSSNVDRGEQDETSNIDREGGIAFVEEVDAPVQENDAAIPAAGDEQEYELADKRVSSAGVNSFEAEDQDTSTLERDLSQEALAVTPSTGQEQESEFADTRVSSEGVASFEAEDQDTYTLERHLSQPASAVTPSTGHQQESELTDTRVSSQDIDSVEAEDQVTSTLERGLSQGALAVTPSTGQQPESELADKRVSSAGVDSFEAEDQDTPTLERDLSHEALAVTPSTAQEPETELADKRVSSAGVDSFEAEDQDTPTLERDLSHEALAVTPSTAQEPETELADKRVSSAGVDSFEAEDQDTSILERHVSQPQMDMSSVASTNVVQSDSSLTNNSSGNATLEKLDPANEQESTDVKAMDGECASTSTTVLDYNKDEREKENMQVKLSFPFSIILWCSQSCSPVSRNRAPSLGS